MLLLITMSKQTETIYISIDVETTGESPITSSCIMIGCVAFRNYDITIDTPDETWIIDKKRWFINEIKDRPMSEKCRISFWDKQPKLLEFIKMNAVDPCIVMKSFADWYKDLTEKYNCVFVARPASFDWQWINCIYDEFGPKDKPILPFSIICISSLKKIFDIIGLDQDFVKKLLIHPRFELSHFADDDALYQAYMYLRIINWIKKNFSEFDQNKKN